ncbi:MAG: hypothetical protein V1679_02605 [Candidatus Peregrinibacteria bacterium]
MIEDKSREGLTGEKVWQLGRLFRPKWNHAIAKVSEFGVIEIERINEELKMNVKGVILDIDECVAPHHGDVLDKNIVPIINMVQQGVRIVIFSNMKSSERYDSLIKAVAETTRYQIKVITSDYAKPDKIGIKECVDSLELGENEDVIMIGDNFLTDGGSIQAGVPFVKVKPIKTEGESFLDKVKRSVQRGSRGFYTGVSNVYDFIGRRKVLRDVDFQSVIDSE